MTMRHNITRHPLDVTFSATNLQRQDEQVNVLPKSFSAKVVRVGHEHAAQYLHITNSLMGGQEAVERGGLFNSSILLVFSTKFIPSVINGGFNRRRKLQP